MHIVCLCFIFIERREAGKPVAHERIQNEGTGMWRSTEDRSEGAERRPPPCSSLSITGQNGGQRHTSHPRARSCKEANDSPVLPFSSPCDLVLIGFVFYTDPNKGQ